MATDNNMLELQEDMVLCIFAEGREQVFDKIKALKHSEVWQQDQAG